MTISAVCPFCDIALIRADAHVHAHLPISQIIPFHVDEVAASAILKQVLSESTGVSRKRKAEILAEIRLKPVYLSYFLFDTELRLTTRVRGTLSDYEDEFRDVELAGWVEGFLVPGCETQGIFASIPSLDGQAWHLESLQDYDPNALAGTLATFPVVPLCEAADFARSYIETQV